MKAVTLGAAASPPFTPQAVAVTIDGREHIGVFRSEGSALAFVRSVKESETGVETKFGKVTQARTVDACEASAIGATARARNTDADGAESVTA